MTCTCARPRLRLFGVPLACLLVSVPLSACAEIEVGAEVAKRISRAGQTTAAPENATAPTDGAVEPVVLAQANTGNTQSQAISPFLKPAPEIFEATGLAVWDGKRTLQGVWVAHPLAQSARRVRIFNQINGQAVDGALFKRDTADNGASILISSEAAQLLGMEVGTPADLRIVAVSPVQRSTEPQASDQTAAAENTDTSANAPVTAKPETESETSVSAIQQPAATPTPATKPEPAAQPKPAATAQPAPQAEQPNTEPEPAIARVEPAQPAASAEPSTLKLPFIQAGIFGVPENASKLVRRIKDKNIPAEGRTLKSKGKNLTRVVAGPFQTVTERNAALRTIRQMGLKDATPVRR